MEEQGLESPKSPSERMAIDELQALATLQVELSSQHDENHWAYVWFMHVNHLRRKHHLEKRHPPGHPWLLGQSCILPAAPRWRTRTSSQEEEEKEELGQNQEDVTRGSGRDITGREPEVPEGSVVLGSGRFQRHSRVEFQQSHTCQCHSHDSGFPLHACV